MKLLPRTKPQWYAFWKRPRWRRYVEHRPHPGVIGGIIGAAIGIAVLREWIVPHWDTIWPWLLVIGAPLTLLWLVVRVVRFAWTGK